MNRSPFPHAFLAVPRLALALALPLGRIATGTTAYAGQPENAPPGSYARAHYDAYLVENCGLLTVEVRRGFELHAATNGARPSDWTTRPRGPQGSMQGSRSTWNGRTAAWAAHAPGAARTARRPPWRSSPGSSERYPKP